MYIVAIGWIYVVLMMAITENSVIAGVTTFMMYCALPLAIILYLTGFRQRKRRRGALKKQALDSGDASIAEPATSNEAGEQASVPTKGNPSQNKLGPDHQ